MIAKRAKYVGSIPSLRGKFAQIKPMDDTGAGYLAFGIVLAKFDIEPFDQAWHELPENCFQPVSNQGEENAQKSQTRNTDHNLQSSD